MCEYSKAKRRSAYVIRMIMTTVDELIDRLLLEDTPAQQNDKQPAVETKLPSATCERSSLSHREKACCNISWRPGQTVWPCGWQ